MRGHLITLAVLVTTACSMPIDRKPAEDAVTKFHGLLDAGQFETIYAASSDDLKGAVKRESFLALLAVIHGKLGSTKSFSAKGWKVKYGMHNALLTLNYVTSYSGGEASEQFVYRMQGDQALLVEYQINSNALGRL